MSASQIGRSNSGADLAVLAPAELAEKFERLFPGLSGVLADPVDKGLARRASAAVALNHLMQVNVRAYGGDEVSPYWSRRVPDAVKLYAGVTGVLGQRETLMPRGKVHAFLAVMGESSVDAALDLIQAMPQLIEQEVAQGNAEDDSAKKSDLAG